MGGHVVTIDWRGRAARAWYPDSVASLEPRLGSEAIRRGERAAAAIRRAADHLPVAWEPVARLLLRAEGVASSNIEGLDAPLPLVAAAEIDPESVGGTAAWVADNLRAAEAALTVPSAAFDAETLHRWHSILMLHSKLPPRMVGRFRTAQGWIGGTSPLDAVYVPPPPEALDGLMQDLFAFLRREDLDAVTQAAIAHAQFETIHPYGDGNGRIGRILIGWVLRERLGIALPPPVSVLIARDVGGYLSGLLLFREGELDRWVEWFAGVAMSAGEATLALLDRIATTLDTWRERTADLRADATARSLLDVLPGNPVLDASVVATRLGVSDRAARGALRLLGERGIVERVDIPTVGPGRPRAWWMASEVMDAVRAWPSGT